MPARTSRHAAPDPVCPGCGSSHTLLRGTVDMVYTFAGAQLETAPPASQYRVCSNCHLHFKTPHLAPGQTNELYRSGTTEWRHELAQRRDWQLALGSLAALAAPGCILDVGCFDGGFLRCAPDSWHKFGIEINQQAAEVARRRGITIAGADWSELADLPRRFDVVVAMDVIEHTVNPLAFLRALSQVTKPQGLILLSTGNSDAWSWRLMGSRYWYCRFNEHISFINSRWTDYAARTLDLERVLLRTFSHAGRVTPSRQLKETAVNLLYRVSPALYRSLRGLPRRLNGDAEQAAAPRAAAPTWFAAYDHFYVVFRPHERAAVQAA